MFGICNNLFSERIDNQTVLVYTEYILKKYTIAGWSSLVARRAHNPKVIGSNPIPAITLQ